MRRLIVLMMLLGLVVMGTSAQNANTVVIEPGQVGVVFNVQTGALEDPLTPGTHAVDPAQFTVTRYSTRQQTFSEGVNARTVDGQEVEVMPFLLFRITDANAIHANWGETYAENFVRPTVRATVREVTSGYSAEGLLFSERAPWIAEIEAQLEAVLAEEGLALFSFDVDDLTFSEVFTQVMEAQQTARMEVEQAQVEAERARVQAEGRAAVLLQQAQAQADAMIILAQARAEAFGIVNDLIQQNPLLVLYDYVQVLREHGEVFVVPGDLPLSFDALGGEN